MLARFGSSLSLALLVLVTLAPTRAHALGDGALVYVAPSSLTVGYDGFANALRDAGASRVDITASWPAASDLAGQYRLVVVTPYEGPLDPAVGDDLATFASAGGGVLVMAEHLGGFEAGNELAARLGIGARFGSSDTGPGCSGTETSAPEHPLTAGAPSLEFAWGIVVEGGTLLYGTTIPVVTTEGTVVLAGDSDTFYDPTGLGSCPVGPSTMRFWQNLFTSLADDSVGPGADAGMSTSDGGTTADAGVSGGGLGASCSSDADCASGPCVTDRGRQYCTQLCTGSCASGYQCEDIGSGVSICIDASSGGGCSVRTPQRGGSLAPSLAIALALLVWRVRRRSSRRLLRLGSARR